MGLHHGMETLELLRKKANIEAITKKEHNSTPLLIFYLMYNIVIFFYYI